MIFILKRDPVVPPSRQVYFKKSVRPTRLLEPIFPFYQSSSLLQQPPNVGDRMQWSAYYGGGHHNGLVNQIRRRRFGPARMCSRRMKDNGGRFVEHRTQPATLGKARACSIPKTLYARLVLMVPRPGVVAAIRLARTATEAPSVAAGCSTRRRTQSQVLSGDWRRTLCNHRNFTWQNGPGQNAGNCQHNHCADPSHGKPLFSYSSVIRETHVGQWPRKGNRIHHLAGSLPRRPQQIWPTHVFNNIAATNTKGLSENGVFAKFSCRRCDVLATREYR